MLSVSMQRQEKIWLMESKKGNVFTKSIQVCIYQFHNRFLTTKTGVVYALLMVIVSFHLRPVADFCIDKSISVTPWVFPFLSSDYMLQIFLVAGAVLLVADAPFKGENRMYLLYRTGNIAWQMGTIFYVALVSVIYVFSIWGIALLSLADVVHLSWEWGRILGTLMQQPMTAVEYGIPIVFNYTIYQYTPLEAMVYSLLLEMGCILFIGLVVYIGNDFLKHRMGVLLAFVYLFLDVMIFNVMPRDVYRLSPLSVCQLGYFNGDMARVGITLEYAWIFFGGSIFLFCAIILLVGNWKRVWLWLAGNKGNV